MKKAPNKRYFLTAIVVIAAILAAYSVRLMHRRPVEANLALAPPEVRCVYGERGSDETLVIGPTVSTTGQVRIVGTVLAHGVIKDVLPADEAKRKYAGANLLECRHVLITPGLVNAHEHLAYSYARPSIRMTPIYRHRDEWRNGESGKEKLESISTDDQAILARVELRHLLHGETTVAGTGGIPGFVKNVSSTALDASGYVADMDTFPLGTEVNKHFGKASCDLNADKLGNIALSAAAPLTTPLVAHIGEGTNCAAKLEIDNFLNYAEKTPNRIYSIVHGIRIEPAHLRELKKNAVSIIWSPRSNAALYGKTLDPAWLLDAGINVGLGTDWSLSGSYDMLEEMKCAKSANTASHERKLSGAELLGMATSGAAKALGLNRQIGTLEVGKAADLAIFDDARSVGLDGIGDLDNAAMIAVFVDGKLQAGDKTRLQGTIPARCQNAVSGKFVCQNFSGYSFTFEQTIAGDKDRVAPMGTQGQAACVLRSQSR